MASVPGSAAPARQTQGQGRPLAPAAFAQKRPGTLLLAACWSTTVAGGCCRVQSPAPAAAWGTARAWAQDCGGVGAWGLWALGFGLAQGLPEEWGEEMVVSVLC